MAHIQVPEGAPGIIGLMMAYPGARQELSALAEELLRSPASSLTTAERELIATRVSSGNECHFCTQSHAAAARELYGSARDVVDCVLEDPRTAPLSDKMKALLDIADKVRRDGRLVRDVDIQRARAAGADDRAIHDTVLIAAAFCMFNRYVDGLGTWAPADPEAYKVAGKKLVTEGYVNYEMDGR
jgi:uncharacterized peroxidase-related enzyme